MFGFGSAKNIWQKLRKKVTTDVQQLEEDLNIAQKELEIIRAMQKDIEWTRVEDLLTELENSNYDQNQYRQLYKTLQNEIEKILDRVKPLSVMKDPHKNLQNDINDVKSDVDELMNEASKLLHTSEDSDNLSNIDKLVEQGIEKVQKKDKNALNPQLINEFEQYKKNKARLIQDLQEWNNWEEYKIDENQLQLIEELEKDIQELENRLENVKKRLDSEDIDTFKDHDIQFEKTIKTTMKIKDKLLDERRHIHLDHVQKTVVDMKRDLKGIVDDAEDLYVKRRKVVKEVQDERRRLKSIAAPLYEGFEKLYEKVNKLETQREKIESVYNMEQGDILSFLKTHKNKRSRGEHRRDIYVITVIDDEMVDLDNRYIDTKVKSQDALEGLKEIENEQQRLLQEMLTIIEELEEEKKNVAMNILTDDDKLQKYKENIGEAIDRTKRRLSNNIKGHEELKNSVNFEHACNLFDLKQGHSSEKFIKNRIENGRHCARKLAELNVDTGDL